MLLDRQANAPTDFDFVIGDWTVEHRRLAQRLRGCTDWLCFEGRSSTRATLGGFGNLEDNLLMLPEGAYRAVALRSFDAPRGLWSIWWLDGRAPHALDTPVVGRFVDGVGEFFCDDVLEGRPIRVRFRWLSQSADGPRWEQAFSDDGGATWETNWTMQFRRA